MHNLKPAQADPAHLQSQQVVKETVEQTTVQSLENQEALDADVDPENREKGYRKRSRKKKKKAVNTKKKQSPDSPGNLLDTVA